MKAKKTPYAIIAGDILIFIYSAEKTRIFSDKTPLFPPKKMLATNFAIINMHETTHNALFSRRSAVCSDSSDFVSFRTETFFIPKHFFIRYIIFSKLQIYALNVFSRTYKAFCTGANVEYKFAVIGDVYIHGKIFTR